MLTNLLLAEMSRLKEMSQQLVFNLAKSNLAHYYYKQSIDGIEEAKKEEWRITL
jgi:hypothetical protein